jgi:polar amino acid transport system permease protein
MKFSLEDLQEFLPSLLTGAAVTITITLISIVLAIMLGIFIALIRSSSYAVPSAFARIFVDVLRGTPLLLQIFYIYYVLPLIGIRLDAYTAGVLALSLNYGAYLSEVFRSGIAAVPGGQKEAAWSLGLSPQSTMSKIVLPQAVRIVIPAVGNYFIALFKDSALVSVISLTELMRAGQLLAASTFQHFEIYTIVAIIYLCISYPASWLVSWTENAFRIGAPKRNFPFLSTRPKKPDGSEQETGR